MSFSEHVPFEQLADLVEGRLPAEAAAVAEAHLASGCALCSARLSFLRPAIRGMRASTWPAPPAHVHKGAVKAFGVLASRSSNRARRLAWGSVAAALAGVVILVISVRGLTFRPAAFTALLTDVSGIVEVRAAGSADWRPSSPYHTVGTGTDIRTAANGRAGLVFPGGDRLQMSADTQVRLTALGQGAGGWRMTVIQASGQTQHQVGPDTAYYEVQTPAGTAVAFGTRFLVQIETDGTTVVSVSEGVVRVTAALKSVTVSPGYMARLVPGQAPSLGLEATSRPMVTPTQPAPATLTSTLATPSPTVDATEAPEATEAQEAE